MFKWSWGKQLYGYSRTWKPRWINTFWVIFKWRWKTITIAYLLYFQKSTIAWGTTQATSYEFPIVPSSVRILWLHLCMACTHWKHALEKGPWAHELVKQWGLGWLWVHSTAVQKCFCLALHRTFFTYFLVTCNFKQFSFNAMDYN